MRFQAGHAEVHAEGFAAPTNFTIAASGKAFKGLIDGLYSRKIEAVIRELATNAFDAHLAAGSLKPFEVHLPTAMKPTFWIRDFGTGMAHDLITHRYTTMFDSTKDGLREEDASLVSPDEQVGCLGLGSKAFFAYTDTCTISVWLDGMVRHYTVFMGPDGVPQLAMAGEAPSDEPVGVKVEFAVKTRDFESFKTAAIRVFKGFPSLPKGLPTDVREALTVETIDMGDFWKSYPDDYLAGYAFWAKQGCVLYPIDLTQIDDRAYQEEEDGEVQLSESYAKFAGIEQTIVFEFPIGAIDFDLSRERLAYNDRTVAALQARWKEFTDSLDNKIAHSFAGLSNDFDRLIAARSPEFSGLGPLFERSSFFTKAGEIEDYIYGQIPRSRGDRNPAKHSFFSIIEFRDEDSTPTEDGKVHDTIRETVFVHYGSCTHKGPDKAWARDAIFVYRDNSSKNVNLRLHRYLRANGKRYAYIFDKGCLKRSRLREMGYPPIVRLSDVPDLPKALIEKMAKEGGRTAGGVFERLKVIDGSGYRAPDSPEDVEGHLFGFINRGMMLNPDPQVYPEISVSDTISLHHILVATGGAPISFVNTRSNDNMERWADLPLFYDVLDTFAERLNRKQLSDLMAIHNHGEFGLSIYETALQTLSKEELKQKNPLTALRRFKRRYNQVDRELLGHYLVLLNSYSPALQKVRNDAIDIARRAGFEVLPPVTEKRQGFGVPILPKEWEEVVTHLVRMNHHHGHHGSTKKFLRGLLFQHATNN